MTTFKDMFRFWGDQADIAKILGVSENAVSKWARRDYLPIKQALRMEHAFGGTAEELVEPQLKQQLLNRPDRRNHYKMGDPRIGKPLCQSDEYAWHGNITPLPDGWFDVVVCSQYIRGKPSDRANIKAQLCLNKEGLSQLSTLITVACNTDLG